jgi:hypothetical protein
MLNVMPQELDVWYLIPSLRKELSKIFTKEYNLTQKETAKFLGVTESAVSQYLKSKRGFSIKFSRSEIEEIKACAEKIINDKPNARKYFYHLSVKLRGTESMCFLHKKNDSSISHNCDLCRNHK